MAEAPSGGEISQSRSLGVHLPEDLTKAELENYVGRSRRITNSFEDHRSFTRNLRVRHKNGKIIDYHLQPSQLKLMRAINEQKEAGKPVRIVVLKARQVMMSTAVAGIFFQKLGFETGRHARIVAHEKDAAGDILDYYKTFHDEYAEHLKYIARSPLVNDANGWMRWANDSWARVQTAANVRSGRSATVSLWHLSEFAFWPNATVLMRGILGSVPKTSDSMVIVESTANGFGNEFHKLCKSAMNPEDPKGAMWKFVFFAWHEHPEYWLPLEMSREEFQRSLDKEEIQLQQRFRLTFEQLQWRRVVLKEEFKGDIDGFKQEYPADPHEAFIASGRPYFSHKSLAIMPVIEPSMRGELVEHKVATRMETYLSLNEDGALAVWKEPQDGHKYVIGADPSKGLDVMEGEGTPDPDWSAACILDYESREQVAQFHARVVTTEFGRYLYALARWYNDAFIVCEGDGLGRAAIEEILRLQYPVSLIYSHRPDLLRGRVTTYQLGYMPTEVTRMQLLARLQLAVIEQSVKIRDELTQTECMTFIYKPDGKPEHQATCHDDCVFSLAYALTGIYEYPTMHLHAAEGTPKIQSYDPRLKSRRR